MAATIPRAARSAIRIGSLLNLSNPSLRNVSRATALRAGSSPRCSSRPFSSSPQHSATPASPTPSKPAYKSTYTPRSTATSPADPSENPTAPITPAKPPSIDEQSPITSIPTSGLADEPLILDEGSRQVDWTRSFHGLSSQPFSKEAADVLLAPLDFDDVEVKPDGIVYLPEIKYRRILNKAFGPGGWGLAPRGETIVTGKSITREYALVAHGRLVSVARGEQDYFNPEGIPTATEGCKSNAMMRCCKDLGVASELWDPRFIRKFMKERAKQIWVEHVPTKKKKQIWLRKDDEVQYPYKESKFGA